MIRYLWTVYHNPSDFDVKYVSRLHVLLPGQEDAITTDAICKASTLEEMHAALMSVGMDKANVIPRAELDDPVIVETWEDVRGSRGAAEGLADVRVSPVADEERDDEEPT